MPRCGSREKANAWSGDVHHDLHRDVGHLVELGGLDGEVELPFVDEPGVTLGARDRDLAPVGQLPGRGAGPDHGRDAELPGDDRGVAGAAAAVGDDRGRALHDRLPVGVGHVGDEDLAGVELVHLLDRGEDPGGAGADLLPDGAALDQHLGPGPGLLGHGEPLQRAASRLHGLRPGLQDVEAAVDTVLAPLDVHGPAVVVLDRERVPGQLLDLVVGQGEPAPLGRVGVHELGGAADGGVVGVDHLGRLLPHPALEHRGAALAQRRLVDVELVGVDRTLDHALAEAVGRGDEDRVGEPGLGVHGEHHPGGTDVGAHHPLHAGGQRDRLVLEAVVDAVGDRPVVVERGEHLADRSQHRVDAPDVEEGLLLAGEGRVGEVLGRCAGPDGERHLRPRLLDQLVVGLADVRLEVVRERLLDHRGPDLLAHLGEPAYVVGVEVPQQLLDPVGQARVTDERLVGRRRGGEAVRHLHAEVGEVGDHLAQRGVLAADLLEVVHAEVAEPAHVRGHLWALRFLVTIWTISVAISSTEREEESITGIRWAE
jgi:hypothetical protein